MAVQPSARLPERHTLITFVETRTEICMSNETINASCDYLLNTLNEVLHGFPVDFQNTLACEQEHVLEVFRKLDACCQSGRPCIEVSDARLLLTCSRLCREQMDADEFETRLGVPVEHALLVERDLSTMLL